MSESRADLREAGRIAYAMVDAIAENKQRLSDIDGLIGDGDHGVNMNKGFQLFRERIEGREPALPAALSTLGEVLLMEIGGSMGPLYGTLFFTMGAALEDSNAIDAAGFGRMLGAGVQAVADLGGAKPGDKTIMDVLFPALKAYRAAMEQDLSFAECLQAMKAAADEGCRRTQDMVAKVGRASRLGERSRGVPDAGATSCSLLLQTIADGLIAILYEGTDET